MSCAIFGNEGAVFGAVTINGEIEPTWTDTYHAHGYGSSTPGSWKPGRYRADCKYGDKLIGRDWFDVTEGSTSPAPVAGVPPSAGAGQFSPEIASMQFFESGVGDVPRAQQVYRDVFDARTARYINAEVTLRHSAPGKVVTVVLTCHFLHGDGSPLGSVKLTYPIQPTWVASYTFGGWGTANPGNWVPGTYRVTCDEDGRTLGQGSFQVR